MSLEEFKNRNVGVQNYITVQDDNYPKTNGEAFKQVVKRSLKGELFNGLKITFNMMKEALFKNQMHTVQYPAEKLPISPRYRAVHKLLALLESGENRCIGCGLCEKICISNCIKMDTRIDENSRKEVLEYTINMGRCIFCGYCAEVCPELAIVHGGRYENASEQRAHFALKEDLLTPLDKLSLQKEYEGFGAVSIDADEKIKKTPLLY
ncbi:NADH-quinone oxidoreductase subunit NuoI [Malaciobacter mytili]|uniref:NADH-quinone oxidoreductase subunit I n=1 Tax=Malaciobacter mytili LMG 24559 TaxID=1032238 RepID=A0AAX2ALC4_9BACT|nr:NADH-quinone oxidoreductase subunit NuoI [Malaciobacter mytili]AXH16169.1 NADH:quinone oxidoreductase I, chain I [Malaciobacter mytili LMG 24559]RXI43284.1 NADH-quinone oxidoreductase subunit NuoI [Malaciobacter mytili]RXK17068.1 NADH-quinone oxidoreductase subunit NuoI [Malaciobacter mytili LMG 24559]